MISITRELARQLRAILRKAGAVRNQRPLLELTSGKGELRIRARLPDVTIEFQQPGPIDQETLAVPFEALEDFEGKSNSAVLLTRTAEGVDASWEDDRIPKCKSYSVSESAIWPTIPEMDWSKKAEVPGLLGALGHASQCVADVQSRYATTRIQLRGDRGEVIATDGRQALIQTGLIFPWKQDLLIPGLALFNCRELPLDLPLTVCQGETHLAIQVGNITLYVAIDKDGRFPDVARALPKATARATSWRLSSEDASFLASSLSKLPGRNDNFAPVTVDLNGQVTLRAREDGQKQSTEVVLAGSAVTGTPVRFHTDRHFLARAAALGFTQITILAADQPILCQDDTRTFVWVPLDKSLAIGPSDKAIRITTEAKANVPEPIKERMNPPMPSANSNGRGHTGGERQANADAIKATTDANGQSNGATEHAENPTAAAGTNLGALIVEAHALRDYLHDGYARASRLCVSLKRHRKQSRLVASTLASLRQLQQIDG